MPTDHSHTLVFKSKRDTWITIFIWSTSLLLWLFAYGIIVTAGPIIERFIGASITISIGLIAPWFWLTTHYRITDNSLHLHSGMFHKALSLSEIKRVTSKGDGSGYSFAFSRDSIHLEVEGSGRGYKVSPLYRGEFISELAKRCSHLKTEGDDLISSSAS
jgi:hypothetical protein